MNKSIDILLKRAHKEYNCQWCGKIIKEKQQYITHKILEKTENGNVKILKNKMHKKCFLNFLDSLENFKQNYNNEDIIKYKYIKDDKIILYEIIFSCFLLVLLIYFTIQTFI